MVMNPLHSGSHNDRRKVCCSCTDTPTSLSHCRGFPQAPDHGHRSLMLVNPMDIHPPTRRDMSLDEILGENNSDRNTNQCRNIRQLTPDFISATSHRQTKGEAFQHTATSRQESSPSPSTVTLPSFQESFPDELCGPSPLVRDPGPINSSTLPPVWSVLNLPTATFAWPQIKPASKMHLEPRLYMNLSVRGSTSELNSNYKMAAETFDNRPSSSCSSWTSSTNSLDTTTHCPESSNSRSRASSSAHQQDTFPSSHLASKATSRTPDALRSPRSKRFQSSKHRASPEDEFRMSPSKDAWQELAKEVNGQDGVPYYTCLGVKKDGMRCAYWAGKQAMKRHIEATHLGIKRHCCNYCPKAFSQKTALQVHEATHTSAKPLECRYLCGEMFSDPGRRHKHYVNAHEYIPKQSKKKSRAQLQAHSYIARRARSDSVTHPNNIQAR